VCVCERERQKERATGTQRDKENVKQHFGFFDPRKKKGAQRKKTEKGLIVKANIVL